MQISVGGILFLLAVIAVPIAIMVAKRWRKGNLAFNKGIIPRRNKEQVVLPNTMIVDDKRGIYFENREELEGIPMTCRNDGRDYMVLRQEDGITTLLEPPDTTEYYDPGEYGSVLVMKAHKDLFERRRTLLQGLAPWALVVTILILGIIWVIASD